MGVGSQRLSDDVDYVASVIRLCHADLRTAIDEELREHRACNGDVTGYSEDELLARVSETIGFHRGLAWMRSLITEPA
jgi:hypothetical protein